MLCYFGFDPRTRTVKRRGTIDVIETIKTTVEHSRVADNGKTIGEIKDVGNRLDKIDIQSYREGLKENKNIEIERLYSLIRVD